MSWELVVHAGWRDCFEGIVRETYGLAGMLCLEPQVGEPVVCIEQNLYVVQLSAAVVSSL